ncbi:MAG: hypothetical protein EA422_16090 [Gemmatimonadales bacterium]|nr:MAG: hypothetical protein EA422_16090 [Gemmatimonadales bacterium]
MALIATLLTACDEPEANSEWELEFRAPVVSQVLMEAHVLPDSVWSPQYAIHHDGKIFVSDRQAPWVWVLSGEGEFLTVIGDQPGEGPGELMRPRVLRPGGEGTFWVYDSGQRRVNHLTWDGSYLESFLFPLGAFAPLQNRRVLLPPAPGSYDPLLIWEGRDVGTAPVGLGPGRPGSMSPMDALLPWAWHMSTGTQDSVTILHVGQGRMWRIQTEGEEWSVNELPLPGPVVQLAQDAAERRRGSMDIPRGNQIVVSLFEDLQHGPDGRAWVTTSLTEMLGMWLEPDDRRATVVLTSPAREFAELRSIIPMGPDTLIAVYEQEVRRLIMGPAGAPDWAMRP